MINVWSLGLPPITWTKVQRPLFLLAAWQQWGGAWTEQWSHAPCCASNFWQKKLSVVFDCFWSTPYTLNGAEGPMYDHCSIQTPLHCKHAVRRNGGFWIPILGINEGPRTRDPSNHSCLFRSVAYDSENTQDNIYFHFTKTIYIEKCLILAWIFFGLFGLCGNSP